MSKLIRDLGAGKDYTLAVSVSDAGIEIVSDPAVLNRGIFPEAAVTLKTEVEVLDFIRALGAACKEKRRMTGGPAFFERTTAFTVAVNQAVREAPHRPHGASVYAVDPEQDSFVIQTGAGKFFDLSLVAVERVVDRMRARKAGTGDEETVKNEDEEALRNRAVRALLEIGRMYSASAVYQAEAASKSLAELVEYLSVKFESLERLEGAADVAKHAWLQEQAARSTSDYLKEMHAVAAKYRGTVIQDSVLLEVAKIEEVTAERIAGWVGSFAPKSHGSPQGRTAYDSIADGVRSGAWKDRKAEARPTGPLSHDRDVAAAFGVSIAEKPAPAPVLPVEDPRVTDYLLDRDAYPTLAYWLDERSGVHPSAQQEIRDLLRHARADAVRFVSDAKASELQAAAASALNTLRDEALRIAVEHGFTDATIGEDFALMHSEISEALEDHRAGKKPDEVWYEAKTPQKDADATVRYCFDEYAAGLKPAGIPSELADVLIRVFHFCGKHGIDIDKAVREKMAYNKSRPMKHGGKKL